MSTKEATKQQPDKAVQLQQLFERLDELIKNQNYKKALKATDDILKLSKKDEDAIAAKIVVLVQLDRCQEALKVLEGANTSVQEDLVFVKAYALYRVGDCDSALKLLVSQQVSGVSGLQLEALLRYRNGEFDKAVQLYEKITKEQSKADWEVKTNQIAACIEAGQSGKISSLGIDGANQYEVVYNNACGQLEQGNYLEAEQLLQKALRLGQETLLGDDWTQEETDVELATIRAQLAYVQYRQGQVEEARENLVELLQLKGLDDQVVRYLAMNNLWVTSGNSQEKKGEGIGEGKSLLKQVQSIFENGSSFQRFSSSLQSRLSQAQKMVLCCNIVILLMLANRKDDRVNLLNMIQAKYPNSAQFGTLQACALAREGKLQEALQSIEQIPETLANTSLLKAQIALLNKQFQLGCEILQQSEFSQSPAVIVTLVAIKEQQKDFSGAEGILKQAMEKHSVSDLASQWYTQKIAELKLKQDQFVEALQVFQQLQSSTKGEGLIDLDLQVRGKFAQAIAVLDPGSAAQVVDQGELESFEQNLEELDLDSIENNLGNLGISGQMNKAGEGQAKRKRKRKPRYPKGFDPENPGPPPNPERWLPKWERSDYKKKHRRRKDKETVKGTQGAGQVDESLDASQFSTSETSSIPEKKPKLPPRAKAGKGRRK
eukprot:TRINITY_DN4226_c1_g1_i2.p1 TRINITY_DN4226_c1_g1~~TRINITY_DN4226_c1_g1_i2.p1  ORF type:complete len:659 (-),score=77.45 TRINITY_DN4226_c1_g1_i2:176-2152(-)